MTQPKINGLYKHYKGNLYRVKGFCTHSETGEQLVLYRALADDKLWARPVAMFFDEINQNGQKHRFELQEDCAIMPE